MKNLSKRILSLLLAFSIVFPVFGNLANVSANNLDVETTAISENKETTTEQVEKDSTKAEENTSVENKELEISNESLADTNVKATEETVSLYFEPTALQVAYKNAIFVNGEFFAFIENAEAHSVNIPKSLLKDGENIITFICGSQALGSYYDETVAPETRNHNDPKVKNLSITKDETKYSPIQVYKYFITDQKVPAKESHNVVEEAYAQDTDYKFGDGAPNGSPHPASLTIPYKIDFKFDLTAENKPEKTNDPNQNIKQVNAHVGADAATEKNLSWVTVENTDVKVTVKDENGKEVFTETVKGTSNEKVYTYTSEVKGLKASSKYTYTLENLSNVVEGEFRTAAPNGTEGKVRFAMLADPQIADATRAEATGAIFKQLSDYSKESPFDFLYIAGDHTDRGADEDQWQALFHNGGLFPNATQDFLLKNTLHSTQGNHDAIDFKGHINTPDEIGEEEFQKGVYSVDYGKVRFININNASYNVKELATNPAFKSMLEFLKKEVKEAKDNGMWTVLGFHKPLYTGASHIDDGDVVEYRKILNPIISELDIDFVLNGHDHVYSRGFVNKDGYNATELDKEKTAENGGVTTFKHVNNAPLHLVSEHSGGLKWYRPVDYTVAEGDPIAPNYEFLDKNSATETPASQDEKEQTYMVIEIDDNQAHFVAYKMKYENGQMVKEPRVYDEFYVTKAVDEKPKETTWDVVDGKVYNGDQVFTAKLGEAASKVELKIDDKAFTGKSSGNAAFNYVSDGIQANDGNKFKNGFAVNGENVDYLNENEPSIKIDESKLKYGEENVITLSIGTNEGPYNESLNPGAKNHDDFKVSKFNIELSNGTIIKPRLVKTYNAVDKETPAIEKNVVKEDAYTDDRIFEMGDGFPGGSNLNYYYKIDLVFDLPAKDNSVVNFNVNTKDFADGDHKAGLYLDDKLVKEANIIFDNTAPEITTNIKDIMEDGAKLTAEVKDAHSKVTETTVMLNGQKIELPYELNSKKLGLDLQFLNITVKDELGNEKTEHFTFKINAEDEDKITNVTSAMDECDYLFNVELSKNISGTGKVRLYKADKFDAKGYKGSSSDIAENLNTDSKVEVKDSTIEAKDTSKLPYVLYEVDTKGQTGDTIISAKAETLKGEIVTLIVYNPTSKKWEQLDAQKSYGKEVKFNREINIEKYAENNKIKLAFTQKLADNGNDVLAWITDTQYYTQRQELKDAKIYEKMTTYLRDEYLKGNISYVAHTGDIVETVGNVEQFDFASKAQAILDDAAVPNGLTTGNHDVGADITRLNYSTYLKTFPASRYSKFFWYGGEYGNNIHHYDLVTIAGNDMIILYLGMGLEATEETVAWANDVLSRYSHRSAIIATHEYLSPAAQWITYARGEEIFNKIIKTNPNVMMTINGHDPGAARNIRKVDDNRQILEILSDYQHQPNGGDGFLRLMKFEGDKVSNVTYSPVTDKYNSFSADKDEFTEPVQLTENNRMVKVSNFVVMYNTTEKPFHEVTAKAGEKVEFKLPSEELKSDVWYATVIDSENETEISDIVDINIDDNSCNIEDTKFGWVRNGDNWNYYDKDGSQVKSAWRWAPLLDEDGNPTTKYNWKYFDSKGNSINQIYTENGSSWLSVAGPSLQYHRGWWLNR
ncbi:metallophosphoesterase, partial [Helcococcus kunzii]|uniref:metallophosphoesterase n=1 Tax=Helcococcus kunzii TaxID=40091 RepID=UPI0024AD2FFF